MSPESSRMLAAALSETTLLCLYFKTKQNISHSNEKQVSSANNEQH